jgi:hypothetical protein
MRTAQYHKPVAAPRCARTGGAQGSTQRSACIAWLALAVAIISVIANGARACVVCGGPYQSLLDRVEASEQVVVARALAQGPSGWQIVRVIKSNDRLDLDQIEPATNSDQIRPGDLQLLRRATAGDAWTNEGAIDRELLAFLARAVELSSSRSALPSVEDQSQLLRYFLPYLEHANPRIADSACHKISSAPYEVVRQIGTHLDSDKLLALIESPQLAGKRRSLYITLLGFCGRQRTSTLIKQWIAERSENGKTDDLAVLLAAHAELNGEDSIRFIEQSYIRNRDRTLDEIVEAVAALRIHGQADGKIPRSRISVSFHLFVRERSPLLELIVEDCTRWEDWSFAPKLMELYAGGKQPWNNARIISYLQACPLPAAKQFVERVEALDTRLSSDASVTQQRNQ